MYWEDEPAQENPLAEEHPLPEDGVRARLRMAQRTLFRTMLRLKVAQREQQVQRAWGERPDRGALMRAQQAYREAEAELRTAWTAWRLEVRDRDAAAKADSASLCPEAMVDSAHVKVEPDAPPRLRFARWLVERGALSEWPETVATPGGPGTPGPLGAGSYAARPSS